MSNWQKIISNFLRTIPFSEKEYQERIVSFIVSLGLGWEDENINQQLSLNLGASQRVIPDIVLFQNDNPIIIIEVKSYHHKQQEKDILQLISYMKQMEINTGIYFGEKVEVYYKELGVNKSPVKLLEIQLTTEEPNWEKFMTLFSKKLYNPNNISSFYKDILRQKEEKSIVKKLTSDLTSPDGVTLVEDAIKNHFSKLGVALPIINQVIENVSIRIIPRVKASLIHAPVQQSMLPVTTTHKGNAAFSINGKGEYGVGKLAWTIVSMVSANNPGLSYEDLKKIFNTWREIIKTIDEINIWKSSTDDKTKDTRWFEKNPIQSNDGVLFAVTTQWTKSNIENIIRPGREYGLTIDRIR